MSEPVPMEQVETIQEGLAQDAPWCTGSITGTPLLPPWEQDWCAHIPPECGAMKEACKPPPTPEGCGNAPQPAPKANFLPQESVEVTFQSIAIAITITLIVSAVLSYLRLKPEETPPPEGDWKKPQRNPSPAEFSNLSPGPDPLAAAREALARGDLGRALMILRAIALDTLEKRGRLVLHPSRTDREYVRALTSFPDEKEQLAALVREIERQRYAARPIDSEAVERAFDATLTLLEKT